MESIVEYFKITNGPQENHFIDDCINITIDWGKYRMAGCKSSNYFKVSEGFYASVILWKLDADKRTLEKFYKVRMLLYWEGRNNVLAFGTRVSREVGESIKRNFKGVLCI